MARKLEKSSSENVGSLLGFRASTMVDERVLRDLWVGIGCQRGVSKLAIQRAIEWVFTKYDLDLATIAGIATLDRKADAVGLVDYCRESRWFLKIYSPERLDAVTVDRSSAVVSALIGTASVAEAAALSAAQTDILLVPKQKFQLDRESGWVTISVARSPLARLRAIENYGSSG